MGCRKANEAFEGLFEGIGLSQESTELLDRYCDKEYLLRTLRWFHFGNDTSIFWDDLVRLTFTKSDDHVEAVGAVLSECMHRLDEKLSTSGFYNNAAVDYCTFVNEFLHGLLSIEIKGCWTDMFERDVFDDWYESLNYHSIEKKHSRIMWVLKRELTPAQFEVIEFEDSHPEFVCFANFNDYDQWRSHRNRKGLYKGEKMFMLDPREYDILGASHWNIRNLLFEQIFEIIFS